MKLHLLLTPIFILFISSFSTISVAQNEAGHFLVEFDKFSPPIQDMIRNFESSKAAPFLAPDIYGKEHFLGDYSGKIVVLWFWSSNDGLNISQINGMNQIQSRFRDQVHVVSFADENSQIMKDFRANNPLDFVVIGSGKVFGEMAYGADLGSGRVFLIDGNGYIQKVIPRAAFEENNEGAFQYIEDMIKSL